MAENKPKKSNKAGRVFLIILAIFLIVFGAVYFGVYVYQNQNADGEQEQLSSLAQTTKAPEKPQLADNPIDFKALQKKNDEIYAWIKIDDTKVDYPICQSKVDDAFYLRHSAIDKSWVSSGAIYTEFSNTKTFKDRVTLIYGHNGYQDSMFTTLHQFEDEKFFDEHPYFYIYTPNQKLTYQLVSAFKYDNRHIMNSFNFQDNKVFADFLEMIQNPTSNNKNVQKNLDKELTIDDNIVVLSTCITGQKSSRYLVCGVLVNNEQTN